MAIALVGTNSTASSATVASISLPTGYASGDLLLVLLNIQGPATATTPSGWTALESNVVNSSGTLSLYWRISDGTEGSSLSVTLSAATYYNCISLAYSGTDTTSPINASAINADTTQIASGGGSTSNPGVTTTVANAMLVHTVSINDSVTTAQSVTFTPPSGFTSEVTSPAQEYVTQQNASQMAQASAGATGAITSSYSISRASYYTTVLLALSPPASASGTGAATTTAPTAAATGTNTSTATIGGTAPTPHASATATASTTGTAAVTVAGPTATAAGGNSSNTGSASVTVAAPHVSGAGWVSTVGVIAAFPAQPHVASAATAASIAAAHAFILQPSVSGVAVGFVPPYPTFPSLQGMGWPVKLVPKFHTITHQAASGATYRTSRWQSPLHTIEAPINFLTQSDYQTLKTFFETQQGRYAPFYFPIINGNSLVCVFPDGLDFEQFMSQLYRTKTLTLQEVR